MRGGGSQLATNLVMRSHVNPLSRSSFRAIVARRTKEATLNVLTARFSDFAPLNGHTADNL
jgi:hypothetical protein